MSETRNLYTARACWGPALPDWVEALAEAADRTSQTAVAERLGVSGSAVNMVLRKRYAADTRRIEQRVRGVLLSATVECPVLGDLAADLCLEWQKKAELFHDTSSLRRRMFRACRACPRSRFTKEETDAQ